jgi:hypothetical protein
MACSGLGSSPVPRDAGGPPTGFLLRSRGILERGAAPPVEPGRSDERGISNDAAW